MARDINMPLALDEIVIPEGRRQVNAAAVKRLADSIEGVGLRHPVTVRRKGESYILVAGLHRMEAYRKLGREHIPAIITSMTNDEARLWEIAENLHRSDLTKLERDEQVAEWIKITERISRQSDEKMRGRPEGGVAAAARDLEISEPDARRAIQVAGLSNEAKEAARETGLDNNRSALLKAAQEPTPERQAARIIKLAEHPASDGETIERQVAALMTAWNKAGPEARKEFLGRIDSPLMDRNFGT
jgi:ParB/RepB/Spo0J family partition protein